LQSWNISWIGPFDESSAALKEDGLVPAHTQVWHAHCGAGANVRQGFKKDESRVRRNLNDGLAARRHRRVDHLIVQESPFTSKCRDGAGETSYCILKRPELLVT